MYIQENEHVKWYLCWCLFNLLNVCHIIFMDQIYEYENSITAHLWRSVSKLTAPQTHTLPLGHTLLIIESDLMKYHQKIYTKS